MEAKVNQIKDLTVLFVSYVKKGANRKEFLVKKAEDGKTANFGCTVKIIKKDDEKRHVYGIVYVPLELDAHNDFMTAETIEKACHEFNENYRMIDKDHSCMPGAGTMIQSYIAPADFEINGVSIAKGSWILVTKANEAVWEEIKKEEYNSYSLWGFGNQEEMKKEDFEKMKESISKGIEISKDYDTTKENDENLNLYKKLRLLEDALWDIMYRGLTKEELKEELIISIDQFKNDIMKMTFVAKGDNRSPKETFIEGKDSAEKTTILEENMEISKEQIEQIKKELQDSLIEKTSISLNEETEKKLVEISGKLEEISKDETVIGIKNQIEVLEKAIDELKKSALDPNSLASNNSDEPKKSKHSSANAKMLGL